MPNCCCKCCCVPICGTCVGLKRQETAKMNEWFLKELPPKGAPSCFERCYFCRCGMDPIPITVPDKFTGVTYQMGGSKRCQTMQQGKWDNEKRRLVLPIQYPGTWALGDHNWCMACGWDFLRLCKCQYVFSFDEELKHGLIVPQINCCCCLPCFPAWCPVPTCCLKFTMTEMEDSTDGLKWHRNSYICGSESKGGYYTLVKILDKDSNKTEFYDQMVTENEPTMLMAY
eukprot:m.212075 g.212075  ORF g.212075 m.212075 type:complete len:228 (+) comp15847_c0_seq1:3120-3803(+)